jgi:hypothetical protein
MLEPARGIRPAQERRCDVRLENDAARLEAIQSDRVRATVHRFGRRVAMLFITFPKVRTAFLDLGKREVEVQRVDVLAELRPNAGNLPPYPLGPPEVRIHFPGQSMERRVPHLSGLFWFDERLNAERMQSLPPFLRPLLEILPGKGLQFGIPCLWRKGGWNQDCDFLFVARQVHRMLVDPGAYSPTDCMNPEGALYWAAHKSELPLEPPIPEIGECPEGRSASRGPGVRFSLREVG